MFGARGTLRTLAVDAEQHRRARETRALRVKRREPRTLSLAARVGKAQVGNRAARAEMTARLVHARDDRGVEPEHLGDRERHPTPRLYRGEDVDAFEVDAGRLRELAQRLHAVGDGV